MGRGKWEGWLRITDKKHPHMTRDTLHGVLLRAAAYNPTRGFTNEKAKSGKWQHFTIGRRPLLRRFEDEIFELEMAGKVEVVIRPLAPPRR